MNETGRDAEALAKQRFILLNLVRLSGLVLVLLGIAIAEQVIVLPRPVGYVLAILGLAEFFFLPNIIARRWRSDEQ